MSEPLSPVQVEAKLRRLVTDLSHAQTTLAEARDTETETEIALKRAQLVASHSADCPRPVRGGITVAERDAWIETECLTEWEAYRRAVTKRETAVDALRTTRDVASVVQSLGSSVRQAFSMAGTT